jgi:hypothetical protein
MPNLCERSSMAERTCSIDGCDGPVVSRGWCRKHYQHWHAYGDPLVMDAAKPPDLAVCSIEGCGRLQRARGCCGRHYENLRKCGDPVPRYDRPLDARLREIGWTVTDSGCWEWNGRRVDGNYGAFDAVRLGFSGARAHRVMYEHHVEPIPDGLDLRHKCDNPPCVNPDHLIPGTRLDNMRDMVERGRNKRTKCVNGHDLTGPGATRETMRGDLLYHLCVECERARRDGANRRERERRRRNREQRRREKIAR